MPLYFTMNGFKNQVPGQRTPVFLKLHLSVTSICVRMCVCVYVYSCKSVCMLTHGWKSTVISSSVFVFNTV